MSENRRPDFDVCVAEPGKDAEGGKKNFYTRVGAAWRDDEGDGISCRIVPGLSVSGKFKLFTRQEG